MNNELSALKFYKNLNKDLELVKAEICCLTNLPEHSNIIKLLDYGDDGEVLKASGSQLHDILYTRFELAHTSLFNLIEVLGGLGEQIGKFLSQQLVDAVDHLHQNGWVHHDLKLENVMLSSSFEVKLCDFGFSTNQNISKLMSFKGSLNYAAPELR